MATEVLGRMGWGREGKKRVSKGRTGRSGHMDQVNGPAGWRNTTGGGVGLCSAPILHLGHGDRECQTGTVRYPGRGGAGCQLLVL